MRICAGTESAKERRRTKSPKKDSFSVFKRERFLYNTRTVRRRQIDCRFVFIGPKRRTLRNFSAATGLNSTRGILSQTPRRQLTVFMRERRAPNGPTRRRRIPRELRRKVTRHVQRRRGRSAYAGRSGERRACVRGANVSESVAGLLFSSAFFGEPAACGRSDARSLYARLSTPRHLPS